MQAGTTPRPIITRLATYGLGVLIVFLGGFGVWSALTSEREAGSLERTRSLADAYETTRNAIDEERLLEHEGAIGHGGKAADHSKMLARKFDRTAARVMPALRQVERLGGPSDRMLVMRVAAMQKDYELAMRSLFAFHISATEVAGKARMVASGSAMTDEEPAMEGMAGTSGQRRSGMQSGGAERLSADDRAGHRAVERRVEALQESFPKLQEEIRTAATSQNTASLEKLGSLRASSRRVFTMMTIALPLAVLLFAGFALVLRSYRRRVEESQRAELDRLATVAVTDNLTGIRNHRAFQEDLDDALAHTERNGVPLSLVLVDLVELKQVNEQFGHQEGDEQLKALATCMVEVTRRSDAAYRIGGDEFAFILTGEPAHGALRLVQRLQSALSTGSRDNTPRARAGIAQTAGPLSKDELIRRADIALLEAKRSNREAVIYAEALGSGTRTVRVRDGSDHLRTLATTLARAVDAKDSATRSHCETVSELAGLIGEDLGLDALAGAKIRLAALLHDVGKIGIPDYILQKPRPLSADEFEIMKTHSLLGYEILSAAKLDEEADWVLRHHERPDGNGYPDGLSGAEIPLESRIILVADAFEAMTADRPYRAGVVAQEALAELQRGAGSQFDPACVEALRRVVALDKVPDLLIEDR